MNMNKAIVKVVSVLHYFIFFYGVSSLCEDLLTDLSRTLGERIFFSLFLAVGFLIFPVKKREIKGQV
jgi:hypothetical protein